MNSLVYTRDRVTKYGGQSTSLSRVLFYIVLILKSKLYVCGGGGGGALLLLMLVTSLSKTAL